VSQAWFYKWRRGDISVRRKRRAALAALIALLFAQHHASYGSPRIWKDLRDSGWRVSKNTVAALMAEEHLVARPKRRRRGLARADKSARKAPDALQRDFAPPPRPDVRWCGDLTEIPTGEGKFYLAAVAGSAIAALCRFRDGRPPTTPRWPGRRCAWRSRSGAGLWPGWCSTPTRAASTEEPRTFRTVAQLRFGFVWRGMILPRPRGISLPRIGSKP
jgi:hypothetical protein